MKKPRPSLFSRLCRYVTDAYGYFIAGVWKDPRDTAWVRIIKTLNLSVASFTDRNLQNKSMALTYSTVLAIVPGFALLLAIGRGFDLSDMISSGLYNYFPAQRQAIHTALTFVDSYLSQASQGVFVGVGIVVLLWTLVSLLSNIEDTFNIIWDIRHNRPIYQKVTDYVAICMMVPILMICSSGIAIFVSTMVQENLSLPFLTPLINSLLEMIPPVLVWLAFTLSYYLIPNTKVYFKYAAISGAICAVAYQVVQLLFINGQIYVSKYNAIYGSFSFLPLLLIWLQVSWLILLFGCVLTFSLQNIFSYNYTGNINNISADYIHKLSLLAAAAIYKNFEKDNRPITRNELCRSYGLPVKLMNNIIDNLTKAGVVYMVVIDKDNQGITPACDFHTFSVGELFRRLDQAGDSDFIPDFNRIFRHYISSFNSLMDNIYSNLNNTLVVDIQIPPLKIKPVAG